MSEDKKEKNINVGDLVCFRLMNPTLDHAPLWQYITERRPAPGVVLSVVRYSALDPNESEDKEIERLTFVKIRWSSGMISEEDLTHVFPFKDCYEQEQRREEREERKRAKQWRERQTAWDWKPEED